MRTGVKPLPTVSLVCKVHAPESSEYIFPVCVGAAAQCMRAEEVHKCEGNVCLWLQFWVSTWAGYIIPNYQESCDFHLSRKSRFALLPRHNLNNFNIRVKALKFLSAKQSGKWTLQGNDAHLEISVYNISDMVQNNFIFSLLLVLSIWNLDSL